MNNLLNDVMGYSLDEEQREVVFDNSKYTIVVAGAGSGKSLTIIGKIRYLIESKNIKEDEILCVSFTREASKNLKEKLRNYYNYNIEVYTFHKLSLEILNGEGIFYNIVPSDLLDYITEEYIYSLVTINNTSMLRILKYFGKFKCKNIKNYYINFVRNNKADVNLLIKNIIRFIRLFKGKNFKLEDIYKFYLENSKKYWFRTKLKNKLFLEIVYDIYLIYEEELSGTKMIDFDDMIIMATNVVSKSYNKNYKYIIIDEYQDTNFIRFNLINKILKKTGANLLVVGDDFQSIYGFTGCNLEMFLNFNQIFDNVETKFLTTTYRNSHELVNIVGNFVMKNKTQIKKKLKSSKNLKYPIEVCYESSKRVLKKLLDKLNKGSVLILSRNNLDINRFLDNELTMKKDGTISYKDNTNDIRFLTVHKSKGLESDNVILLNVVNTPLGFPNKLNNDKVFEFLLDKDNLLDEERRLFYVAITRTKNKVYILSDKNRPSVFLGELKHDLKTFTYNEL